MPQSPTPITDSLASIATDWPLLLDDVAAATYGSGAPSIGSAPSGNKLPGGTEMMSLIAEGRHVLSVWCHLVLDERGDHYDLGSTHLDGTDGAGMATWLKPHADWIAKHDLGYEAEEELDRLARRLRGLVEPSGLRRPEVGGCPIDGCDGKIRGQISDRSSDDEARDLICDVDSKHRWDQSRWRLLGAMLGHIHRDEPEWMGPDDLAEWMSRRFRRSIKPNTVRQWAVRHPLSIRAREGKYDRIAVADWYIERQVSKAG